MAAPYQLPSDLQNQPLGISWATLGAQQSLRPNPAENAAALMQVAWQASGQVDTEAGQVLRATLNTETLVGPAHRLAILDNGNARFLTSQNPVLQAVGIQVSPARIWAPITWTTVPPGHFSPAEEAYGIYNPSGPGQAHGGSQALLIDSTYVNWSLGRQGYRVQASYFAGWPHTVSTADAESGQASIDVEDVGAWEGASGWISDGQNTETFTCMNAVASLAPAYSPTFNYMPGQSVSETDGNNYLCVVANGPMTANGPQAPTLGATSAYWMANPPPTGPGTLTMFTNFAYDHAAPVLVTTIPPNVRWACALFAKAQALQRGIATMTIGNAGATQSSGGLEGAIASAQKEAAMEIINFRRTY